MFKTLDDHLLVAGQITAADIAEAARQGVTRIVNNRPDGEEPGQPAAARIEEAARVAGLDYVAIPVDHSGFDRGQVDAMADALDGAKVLAFCRSGTRSTILAGLARASRGADPETLVGKAAAAGYDLRPYLPMLRSLGPTSQN